MTTVTASTIPRTIVRVLSLCMPSTHLNYLAAFEAQEVPMNATGATSLGSPGRRFFPAQAYIITTTAPTILGLASISIGTNASAYNNIVPITLLTSLGTTDVGREIAIGARPVVTSEEELFVNVNVAVTSGAGIMHVILAGWFFDYDADMLLASEPELM